MIKEAIQHIELILEQMNLFEKVYSQVELVINSDKKVIPAVYIGNGKYKQVEYSANNGTIYVRKNGNVSFNEIEVIGIPACEVATQVRIPLRVVAFKNKNRLPIDCSYTEDLLAETIIHHLSTNNKGLKKSANALQASIQITGIDTNSSSVWNDETDNVEQIDVNYTIACVAIEFDVVLLTNTNCFNNMCAVQGD